MAGLNKVMLIGNLGRDPEIRYTQQGLAVVNLSIATSEQWTDKNTGERQEKTEWHRVVFFGKQAETCERYLSKGSRIYVEGRLQTRSYEKEGQTHYSTEIIGNNFMFLGGRQEGQGNYQGGGGHQQGQGGYQGGGGNYQGGGYQGGGGNYQGGGSGYPQQGGPAPNSNNFQGQTSPGMTGGSQDQGPDNDQAPIPDDDIPF